MKKCNDYGGEMLWVHGRDNLFLYLWISIRRGVFFLFLRFLGLGFDELVFFGGGGDFMFGSGDI